jgi:hypothetical protein
LRDKFTREEQFYLGKTDLEFRDFVVKLVSDPKKPEERLNKGC